MCRDCWEEYGCPADVTEEIRHAAALIAEVYLQHGAGGHLHIVVDDWNIEDGYISYCSDLINQKAYSDAPEQLSAERAACDALMSMTVTERAVALALHDGLLER